jgi:hypothetical protein
VSPPANAMVNKSSHSMDGIRDSDTFDEISGSMGGIGLSPGTIQSVPVIICRPMWMFFRSRHHVLY